MQSAEYDLARLTLDMVSDMVFWLDSTSRFFMVNKAACQVLEFSMEELLGMSVYDIDVKHPKEQWSDTLAQLLGGEKRLFTSVFTTKKGDTLPVEVHAHIIDFKEEKFICATVRDISERTGFETALRESEEKYQTSFQNVPSAVYLSSIPEGRLLEVNKSFELISGFSREEMIGKTVEELNFYVKPEDRTTLLSVFQRDGKLKEYEIYYRIKSGAHRLCSVNAEPILIAGKTYLVGNITDITDQREAQILLQASEERNRLLLEHLPVGTLISARSGKAKYISANAEKITGFSSEEILSMPVGILDRTHPDDLKKLLESLERLFDAGETMDVEFRIRNKQGHWAWLHFQSNIVREFEGERCFFGVVSDITARKEAEEKILENEIKFRTMVNTSPDGVTTTDLEGKITFASKRKLELHGYDHLNELLGLDKMNLIAPENREEANRISQDIETTGKFQNNEYNLLRKDGTTFIGELSISALTDETGKINGFIAITRDITERKKIESALIKSEERYRMLIENMPNVTWVSNPSGETTFISPNIEKIYGYTSEEIYKGGEDLWFGRVHPDDLPALKNAYGDLIEKGIPIDIEYRIKRKDEQWIWLHDKGLMTYKENKEVLAYGVFSDITERKQSEEQLQESEEKFRQLVNNLDEVFWIVSPDWTDIAYVSPSFEKVWGKPIKSLFENPLSWMDSIIRKDRILVEESIKNIDSDYDIVIFPDYRIVQPKGSVRWIRAKGYPVRDASGKIVRIAGIAEDITLRKKTEEVIQNLVGNTSAFTGEDYFRNLVKELSITLETDYVFIATPVGDNPGKVETIALSYRGKYAKGFAYDLKNTPCKGVFSDGICQYQGDVQTLFPKDQLLIDMGITSYSGIALKDTQNHILGILVVLNQSEFKEPEFIKNILELSSIRAGAELERIVSDQALKKSEASFRALLNATTEVAFMIDKKEILQTLNDSFANELGQDVESLIGKNAFNLLQPKLANERRKHFKEVNRTRKSVRFVDQNQGQWSDNNIYPIMDAEGQIERYAIYSKDITEQKIAEEQLRKSEEKFSSAFYTSPHFMGISTLEEGEFLAVNDAIKDIFAYSKDEVIGRKVTDLGLYASPSTRQEIVSRLRTGNKIQRMDVKARKKDGELFDAEYSASVLVLDGQKCLLSIVDDVTTKKQAERDLLIYQDNLRSMASELATVEDREKRTIAEYLHDHLGQSLALAKIKIGSALRKEPRQEIAGLLNDIEYDITDAINYSQSVIYELSPPILYELGLLEALKWKMDEFEKKQGIKTKLSIPAKISTMEQDISIVLFRSVTEILNNVVKHAAATAVTLSIVEEKDSIRLSVSDNGIGFDYNPSKVDHSKDHKFGLFSIREKMIYIGGGMDIKPAEKGGTVISLFVPLN